MTGPGLGMVPGPGWIANNTTNQEGWIMSYYWIHANISGRAKWHLVYDKDPGLYFVSEDFEEEEYDIATYRKEFPDNEVVDVLNVHQTKQPLGICDDHIKAWNRVECPLCDFLFVYERLRLALEVMEEAVCLLSEMPEIENGVDDEEQDEANRGRACINLSKFLEYAKIGMSGGTCSCDEVGEGRCSKHGWETFAASLRWAKKGNGA